MMQGRQASRNFTDYRRAARLVAWALLAVIFVAIVLTAVEAGRGYRWLEALLLLGVAGVGTWRLTRPRSVSDASGTDTPAQADFETALVERVSQIGPFLQP